MIYYVLERKNNYYLSDASDSSGSYVVTGDLSRAKKFVSETEAGIFRKNLPRTLKNLGFKVREINKEGNDLKIVYKDIPFDAYDDDNDDDINDFDLVITTEKEFEIFDELPMTMNEIHEFANELITMIDIVKNYDLELKLRLADIEKSIIDMLHYIEFKNLNAREGYKIYKRLHNTRIERRKIKNTMLIINIFKELGCINTDEIEARLSGLNTRKYKVRVPENFEENFNEDA